MKQSLHLKISQQLTLTPQLKQSLKLLQLSSLDLEQEVQQALDSNPLLDRDESETVAEQELNTDSSPQENRIPQPISEAADPIFELERTDHLAPEQDLSSNLQESFESRRVSNVRNSDSEREAEFTHYASKQESLFEHLSWQIQMTTLSERDRLIAGTLLRCLDQEGYLTCDTSEVCNILDPDLEVEEDEVQAVLSLVKTLDPIGAGARDLSERLLILLSQLPSDTPGFELASVILENHLDLVGSRNLSRLRKDLNASEHSLTLSLSLITNLNPRIGAPFTSDNENYIIPDVQVKKVGETWAAQINPDNQTRLRVNQTYSDLLKSNLDKEGNEYIQQNLMDAKMFIKGLMSRYDTLLLVSEAIVKRQQAFFENGEEAMQPMILQDIAEQLELHESTISRATAGKYLLCPRGVYELKYFFSSALSTTDGAGSSSTAIRSLIKKMIETEPKAKPLSDSKIAKELEHQGHIVARRTVAKYRESMQIAPSSQRKSLV